MVNGLGGTPISELYIVYGRAAQKLADGGINVTRSYVGEYCTSLDMAGASITLVKLDKELNDLFDAELLYLLDGVQGDGEDDLRGGGGFDGEGGHGQP
jgi:dihydroxyacetone kinase